MRSRILIAGAAAAVLAAGVAAAPQAPGLVGIVRWLNVSQPPTPAELKGKVVLVNFWTYSCINCIRTMPQLKSWYERYHAQGLEVIGVHTPEFHFEKDPANVQAAIAKFGIPFPVAMDDNYKTWDAFASRTWPSDFLIDRTGAVRYRHFGEANYERIEGQIQSLLAEHNPGFVKPDAAAPPKVDFSKIKSRQIYLGLLRLSSLGNSETIIPGKPQTFAQPKQLRKHKVYLVGEWMFGKESAHLKSDEGKLLLRYDANKANIVLASEANRDAVVEVLVDGEYATEANRGIDVSLEGGRAITRINFSRMYNFSNSSYGEHILELRFKGRGIKVYTITFG